jgi:ribonuclease HI
MPPTEPRQRPAAINATVDPALLAPTSNHQHALLRLRRRVGTTPLAERVRQRATALARRHRPLTRAILDRRDLLIQQIYADATPKSWHTAWCDGSVNVSARNRRATIGALLADTGGETLESFAREVDATTSFDTELAALEATLGAALARRIERLRVHTDCRALAELWHEQRMDPRLTTLRMLVGRFRRFGLCVVPRLHNQSANRLARAVLSV